MENSRQTLAALILGGVGILLCFLKLAPIGLLLSVVGLMLTAQALRGGERKLPALCSMALNGAALVLNLLASLMIMLVHLIF